MFDSYSLWWGKGNPERYLPDRLGGIQYLFWKLCLTLAEDTVKKKKKFLRAKIYTKLNKFVH